MKLRCGDTNYSFSQGSGNLIMLLKSEVMKQKRDWHGKEIIYTVQ